MSNWPHPIIAREGWPFLALATIVSAVITYFFGWWSVPFWIVTVFILQFFRDPPREIPQGEGLVLCPADGRVIVVAQTADPYRGGAPSLKISMFMNVFNVHSQRSPVDATITSIKYDKGLFVNASFDKASSDNERNALILRLDNGTEISCVQVAGLIARRRGIYLLPNLFTTAALFAGFYAIVQAMNVNFDQAAIAIFVAMVLDGLDGRVARMTRTQSAFGAEFDSLADMVSFGAAPALVMYEWVLRDLGKLGWIAAFVYVAGAALRLARFNTLLEVADKRWFMGLPSPSAAALVAGLVWVVDDLAYDPNDLRWLAWTVTLFAGLTMVSNLKYYSFKTVNLKRSVPFVAIFLFALLLALLSYQPPLVLFAAFVAYGVSGYVVSAWMMVRERRLRTAGSR
jgi:CDP-diacylglycerol--serine O-phosphatidyltransferase